MKLKTGATRRVHASNTRGAAFHGIGAFVGIGKTQRAHVYTAASTAGRTRRTTRRSIRRSWRVNSRSIMCAVNNGRFWMMDEVELRRRRHRQTSTASR